MPFSLDLSKNPYRVRGLEISIEEIDLRSKIKK